MIGLPWLVIVPSIFLVHHLVTAYFTVGVSLLLHQYLRTAQPDSLSGSMTILWLVSEMPTVA